MLLEVVHIVVSSVPNWVMHIEKLASLCSFKQFAMNALPSTPDTVYVNNARRRFWQGAESEYVDAALKPVTTSIDSL